MRTRGANTLHEVTETLRCWARSSPSQTLSRVSPLKLPLFSYANSRHFSNKVTFNLCSTLQCFGKLQLWAGPRICERCIPWVNLERATFIYTHQQGLVNFPCRVILVCYHKVVSCWEIFLWTGRRMLFWAGVTQARTSGLPTWRASRDRWPPSITRALLPGLDFWLRISKGQQCSPERSTAGQSSLFYFLV